MIIRRQREYSSGKKVLGAGLITAGLGTLATVRPNKLIGRVVRYHNTDKSNVDDILEHGIKNKYATDPNNLTNTQNFTKDIDIDKKKGLIYTSHSKSLANGVGISRAVRSSKLNLKDLSEKEIKEIIKEEEKNPKYSKTLKLIFDYDKDIKGKPKIENPEKLGAKSPEEYLEREPRMKELKYAKKRFKVLDQDTHVFDEDIEPSHIKESKHYKKRTLADVKNYIKNNPKRSGKEIAKVLGGTGLVVAGSILMKKKGK